MGHFGIIVNGWRPLTIITKSSILDVAAVLNPPMATLVVSHTAQRHFENPVDHLKCSIFRKQLAAESRQLFSQKDPP